MRKKSHNICLKNRFTERIKGGSRWLEVRRLPLVLPKSFILAQDSRSLEDWILLDAFGHLGSGLELWASFACFLTY